MQHYLPSILLSLSTFLLASPALADEKKAVEPALAPMRAITMPSRDLDLASEISGIVAKVNVEEGDHVKQGQVLIEMKSDVPWAQLEMSRASLQAADHQIAYYEATFKTKKAVYERTAYLVAQKAGATVEERDKDELEMELARISIDIARAQKKVNDYTVARNEAAVEQYKVRAPNDGEIFRILSRPGEATQEQRPVIKMVSTDPLYVIVNTVPVDTFGRIKVGMKATLTLENMPGKTFECAVMVVDSVGEVGSGTYRVKLTLPNPDGKINAGLQGRITFKPGS